MGRKVRIEWQCWSVVQRSLRYWGEDTAGASWVFKASWGLDLSWCGCWRSMVRFAKVEMDAHMRKSSGTLRGGLQLCRSREGENFHLAPELRVRVVGEYLGFRHVRDTCHSEAGRAN